MVKAAPQLRSFLAPISVKLVTLLSIVLVSVLMPLSNVMGTADVQAATTATVPAGKWSTPLKTGICAGEYQFTAQEKADFSTTGWAHHPSQFKAVLCSGWKGSLDYAIEDVSTTLSIGGWDGSDASRYYIGDVVSMINTYWGQLNPGGTLFVSGFHEMNGNWAEYAECRGARPTPCQLTPARWAALQKVQYQALKAGLKTTVKTKYVVALNYTSHTKIGSTWYNTNPDNWVRAAKSASVPFDVIGVSMYQTDLGTTWTKFKPSTMQDQARCVAAKQTPAACKLRAPLGPDSWVAAAKAYGKPLIWREWGGKTSAWMAGAKSYLVTARAKQLIIAEAHLYDSSRKACHYNSASGKCYFDTHKQ